MIRFPTMGMKIFASDVVPSEILSKDEVLQMFMHFANPISTPSPYDTTPRLKNITKIPRKIPPFPDFMITTGNRLRSASIEGVGTQSSRIAQLPAELT